MTSASVSNLRCGFSALESKVAPRANDSPPGKIISKRVENPVCNISQFPLFLLGWRTHVLLTGQLSNSQTLSLPSQSATHSQNSVGARATKFPRSPPSDETRAKNRSAHKDKEKGSVHIDFRSIIPSGGSGADLLLARIPSKMEGARDVKSRRYFIGNFTAHGG